MAYDWSSLMGGGSSKSIPADTEVVGPSDTFTGASRGNDTGGKTEREYAEQGGALKKKSSLSGPGGGKQEKQWDRNAPEDNAQPNTGGGRTAGLRSWQKPREGTSPPMPWDNNPGPTVPKMGNISGGEHDWQRSGYRAVPDPTKLVD